MIKVGSVININKNIQFGCKNPPLKHMPKRNLYIEQQENMFKRLDTRQYLQPLPLTPERINDAHSVLEASKKVLMEAMNEFDIARKEIADLPSDGANFSYKYVFYPDGTEKTIKYIDFQGRGNEVCEVRIPRYDGLDDVYNFMHGIDVEYGVTRIAGCDISSNNRYLFDYNSDKLKCYQEGICKGISGIISFKTKEIIYDNDKVIEYCVFGDV